MQPQRPKEPRREMITWEEVGRLIDHLIPQFRREFTAMVMITRGGVIPGGLLAEAMDITHILTAAVDFPAQNMQEKSKLIAWPQFIQFPADDKLRGAGEEEGAQRNDGQQMLHEGVPAGRKGGDYTGSAAPSVGGAVRVEVRCRTGLIS